jgi:hypothetical protein
MSESSDEEQPHVCRRYLAGQCYKCHRELCSGCWFNGKECLACNHHYCDACTPSQLVELPYSKGDLWLCRGRCLSEYLTDLLNIPYPPQ